MAGTVGQLNLYAYCNNNPIMYTDETGYYFKIATHSHKDTWGFEFNGIDYFKPFIWVGISTYYSKDNENGFFYTYSSNKIDLGSWTDLNPSSYGIGINFWNAASIEAGVKFIGIEASISIWKINLSVNINLLGGTSIGIGYTTSEANGVLKTKEVTIGANAMLVALTIFSYYLTGSPVQQPSFA